MTKYRYQVTEAGIERKVTEGRGTGRGIDYQPWLTVQEVASYGCSSRIVGTKSRRLYHFLSRNELGAFLDCDWHPVVRDVREQFPLPREDTRRIARVMGVAHPRYRDVDIVMTTDLLVDLARDGGPTRQVAICVKPFCELENPRISEKLEIERRYWASRDVRYRVVTQRELSEQRRNNLMWLYEWRWLDNLEVPYPGYWEERCDELLGALTRARQGIRTVNEVLQSVEHSRGWQKGEALSALRHLSATRLIEFDLDQRFDTRGPLDQLRIRSDRAAVRGGANVRYA